MGPVLRHPGIALRDTRVERVQGNRRAGKRRGQVGSGDFDEIPGSSAGGGSRAPDERKRIVEERGIRVRHARVDARESLDISPGFSWVGTGRGVEAEVFSALRRGAKSHEESAGIHAGSPDV